jgi:hypothetical protein
MLLHLRQIFLRPASVALYEIRVRKLNSELTIFPISVITMKLLSALALVGSAAAFAPAKTSSVSQ